MSHCWLLNHSLAQIHLFCRVISINWIASWGLFGSLMGVFVAFVAPHFSLLAYKKGKGIKCLVLAWKREFYYYDIIISDSWSPWPFLLLNTPSPLRCVSLAIHFAPYMDIHLIHQIFFTSSRHVFYSCHTQYNKQFNQSHLKFTDRWEKKSLESERWRENASESCKFNLRAMKIFINSFSRGSVRFFGVHKFLSQKWSDCRLAN